MSNNNLSYLPDKDTCPKCDQNGLKVVPDGYSYYQLDCVHCPYQVWFTLDSLDYLLKALKVKQEYLESLKLSIVLENQK